MYFHIVTHEILITQKVMYLQTMLRRVLWQRLNVATRYIANWITTLYEFRNITYKLELIHTYYRILSLFGTYRSLLPTGQIAVYNSTWSLTTRRLSSRFHSIICPAGLRPMLLRSTQVPFLQRLFTDGGRCHQDAVRPTKTNHQQNGS
jgi:hypothetical protein